MRSHLKSLQRIYAESENSTRRRSVAALSRVLNALGVTTACVIPPSSQRQRSLESLMAVKSAEQVAAQHGIPTEWLRWAWRWCSTSTLLRKTRIYHYSKL